MKSERGRHREIYITKFEARVYNMLTMRLERQEETDENNPEIRGIYSRGISYLFYFKYISLARLNRSLFQQDHEIYDCSKITTAMNTNKWMLLQMTEAKKLT